MSVVSWRCGDSNGCVVVEEEVEVVVLGMTSLAEVFVLGISFGEK